jgi:hypothetical protein
MTTTQRRPVHHSALAILFPLAAHWHHRRYHGKPHHLVADSMLNVVILGIILWLSITLMVVVQPSNLGVHVQIPTLRMNEQAEINVVVANEGSQKISDLQLSVVAPSSMRIPASQQRQRLEGIAAGSQHDFSLEFSPLRSGALQFVVRGTRNGIPVTQRMIVQASVADLPVALTASRTTLALGRTTPVRIDLRSLSDMTLDHVTILVQADADTGVERGASWTIEHLAPHTSVSHTILLRPQRSGVRTITVRPGVQHGTTTYFSTSTTLRLNVPAATTGEVLQDLGTQQSANIATEAMYFSSVGFQFGYGTIPLTVHQETTVRIFWYIRPSATAASSAMVTAVLPSNIHWKGNSAVSSGSAISYDAGQRRVRWAIGRWNAAQDMLTGSFDVAITPTASMVGSFPTLVQPSILTYRGTDDRLVTVQSSAATTRTIDPNNSLAGKVRK